MQRSTQVKQPNPGTITDSPIARFLFTDTRMAWLWLPVRVWLGAGSLDLYQDLERGIEHRLQSRHGRSGGGCGLRTKRGDFSGLSIRQGHGQDVAQS